MITDLGDDKPKEFLDAVMGKQDEKKEEATAEEEKCGSCYGAETEQLK